MKDAQPNKRQHPATPLGNLLNKYGLSLRRVETMLKDVGCEISSKTTVLRFVNGTIGPHLRAQVSPHLAKVLAEYMIKQGTAKSDIDTQLLEIFNEGEYQPMISRRIALTNAEAEFFGLTRDPFKEFPQSREEVFMPPPLREIYDAVNDAIMYRHFVAVIGPIGSGKTTLRSMIEDHVAGQDSIRLIWPEFFDQARISPTGIARTILKECDAHIPGRTEDVGRAVKGKLQSLTANGKRVALAFDECHKMNKDAVRSLKNFFEMSSGGFQKYLGIVLFGWPSFVSTLEMPEFQEIYERIHVLEMPDFHTYAAAYLEHRLQLVGRRTADLFDQAAVDMICAQAETPLSLGNIANEALRISKRDFDETKVHGAAIGTKMFFESPRETHSFRKR